MNNRERKVADTLADIRESFAPWLEKLAEAVVAAEEVIAEEPDVHATDIWATHIPRERRLVLAAGKNCFEESPRNITATAKAFRRIMIKRGWSYERGMPAAVKNRKPAAPDNSEMEAMRSEMSEIKELLKSLTENKKPEDPPPPEQPRQPGFPPPPPKRGF